MEESIRSRTEGGAPPKLQKRNLVRRPGFKTKSFPPTCSCKKLLLQESFDLLVSFHSTFRDAATVLPWVALDLLEVDRCSVASLSDLWFLAAKPTSGGPFRFPSEALVTHDSCIAEPGLLAFASWSVDSHLPVRSFCLDSLEYPSPMHSFNQLSSRLHRLRLFADVVRGVLLLWTLGRPAFLITPPFSCPGLDVVCQLGKVRLARDGFSLGLSRITWVFYASARRLLRERIIDDTSSYQALRLLFHILRCLQHALRARICQSPVGLRGPPIFARVCACVL